MFLHCWQLSISSSDSSHAPYLESEFHNYRVVSAPLRGRTSISELIVTWSIFFTTRPPGETQVPLCTSLWELLPQSFAHYSRFPFSHSDSYFFTGVTPQGKYQYSAPLPFINRTYSKIWWQKDRFFAVSRTLTVLVTSYVIPESMTYYVVYVNKDA